MRIGILWNNELYKNDTDIFLYGCGRNTGNLLFLAAIEKIFSGTRVPWHCPADHINKNYDLLVFPAANQLGIHSDLSPLADLWASYDIPILTIGLGLQSKIGQKPILKDGTQRWLHSLLQNTLRYNNPVFVRGNLTAKFISEYNSSLKILPIGCPSQILSDYSFINNSFIKKQSGVLSLMSVSAPDPSWTIIKNIHKESIQYITNQNIDKSYIIQHPLDLFLAIRSVDLDMSSRIYKEFQNLSGISGINSIQKWLNEFGTSFTDVSQWINNNKRFDFSVNFRIHGCIASLLSGTPSMLFPIDSRTLELAQILNIPYSLDYQNININQIKKILYHFSFVESTNRWKSNMKILLDYLQISNIPHNPNIGVSA
jgi:hypothetical protein